MQWNDETWTCDCKTTNAIFRKTCRYCNKAAPVEAASARAAWKERITGATVTRPDGVKSTTIDRTKVPRGMCDLCGKTAELRPYGRSGEFICFSCGKKDVAATERKMGETIFGGGPHDKQRH